MRTHSEHQACTIKILQPLCVSHKIVERYRTQHAPKFSKRQIMGMMCQWQHGPVSSQDVTPSETGQNIGQAPWVEWICALYKCSINQSINQNQKHKEQGQISHIWFIHKHTQRARARNSRVLYSATSSSSSLATNVSHCSISAWLTCSTLLPVFSWNTDTWLTY
jgi:hypothetical protein